MPRWPERIVKRRINFAVVLGALVLLLAVGLQWRNGAGNWPGRGVHLARELPTNLPGWTSRAVPLGATEAVSGAVEKVLKFDDVFYRNYRRADGATLGLYVAYWNPGKMPTDLVAMHTPDRCWTESGWTCAQRREGVQLAAGAVRLKPGEWRDFTAPDGGRTYVVYWQLVGRQLYDFGDERNQLAAAWSRWREATGRIFRPPPDQYFIRLTSDQPFEVWRADPGYREMLEALGKLGLGTEEGRPEAKGWRREANWD